MKLLHPYIEHEILICTIHVYVHYQWPFVREKVDNSSTSETRECDEVRVRGKYVAYHREN